MPCVTSKATEFPARSRCLPDYSQLSLKFLLLEYLLEARWRQNDEVAFPPPHFVLHTCRFSCFGLFHVLLLDVSGVNFSFSRWVRTEVTQIGQKCFKVVRSERVSVGFENKKFLKGDIWRPNLLHQGLQEAVIVLITTRVYITYSLQLTTMSFSLLSSKHWLFHF